MDAITEKEKQNAKKVHALGQIQVEAVAIAEGQQWHIERNAISATTSVVETS